MQTETTYRGLIIRQVKNFDENALGCLGFSINTTYQVVDDFDDLAIPGLLQQTFWSPYEAMVAIDYAVDLMPGVNRNDKYATAIAYEFNRLLTMRRNIVPLAIAIAELKEKADDANELDDTMPIDVVLTAIGRMTATKFHL